MLLNKDKKILIVGLGLLGGSYAQALTQKGFEVGAIDLSQDSIAYALSRGMIAHGKWEVTKDYVEQFDIVVFALYPKVLTAWIEKYQHFFKSGAILTDVTGVKCAVVYDIQALLRPDVEFIGAHPMAGREVYGVENANPHMFLGANYIVTPTEQNTPAAIALSEDIGHLLGFGTVTRLSPPEHDEMIGFLSQLTHCIAVSLMTSRDTAALVDYSGDSFRDLTRIAKINEHMWSELFLSNKEPLLRQMDLFLDQFVKLREYLITEDKEKMEEMMRLSTKQRELFDTHQPPRRR